MVSYPQGSGGTWFAHLLDCMVNNNQFHESRTNWHGAKPVRNPRVKILVNHELENPDFNLSGSCLYNFWCYYYVKRFVYDLGGPRPVRNANNKIVRMVDSPYHRTPTPRESFEWMFLQARFIAQYNQRNQYNLDWQDLIWRPGTFYHRVVSVLEQRQIPYEYDYGFFLEARNSYIRSVRDLKRSDLNTNHQHYQLWELAYIDGVLDRAPGFDYFDAWGTDRMHDWVQPFRSQVLEDTKALYLQI